MCYRSVKTAQVEQIHLWRAYRLVIGLRHAYSSKPALHWMAKIGNRELIRRIQSLVVHLQFHVILPAYQTAAS